MEYIQQMFEHTGKTTKVVGNARIKVYKELYDYITEKQGSELPYHGDYLGNNELAQSIYQKKYYLKDLDNKLIETQPEDVFKRLAAFMATVEGGKAKHKKGLGRLHAGHPNPRLVTFLSSSTWLCIA